MGVHPSAVIYPSVRVPESCIIGPFSVIDEGVLLSAGVKLGCGCHVHRGARLEEGVVLHDGAIVGSDPQDLKYRGENTGTVIGRNTVIREYVTVSRGTAARGVTTIGEQCMIMGYAHVAHDCDIGSRVIIANSVQMGGHVKIGDCSIISGMTGIHQFSSIGAGVFVGGGLRVASDIPPFSRALGEPLTWAGINDPGLQKLGFGREMRSFLSGVFRVLGTEGRSAAEAVFSGILPELEGMDRMKTVWSDFFGASKRKILRRNRG